MEAWNERAITLSAENVETVYFSGTLPNYFFIKNMGGSSIYASVASVPNSDNYDLEIAGNTKNIYCRGIPFSSVMIYNPATTPIKIVFTSYNDVFSPAVMGAPQPVEIVGGGSDMVVRGFAAPLPVGGNNIGKVEVSTLPTVTVGTLPALPTGGNVIGKVEIKSLPNVNIDTLPSLPAGDKHIGKFEIDTPLPIGTNHIGSVTIDGGISVGNVTTIEPAGVFSSHGGAVVGGSPITYTPPTGRKIQKINILSNDGLGDMVVGFGGVSMMLKAGESMTDISCGGDLGDIILTSTLGTDFRLLFTSH